MFALNNDNTFVGILNIRYEQTDFYKDSGHIGYSVRSSQRRKGYTKQMFKETLKLA